MNLTICASTDAHRADIRQIHTAAFGQIAEAELVDALVDGGFAVVSLVAKIAGSAIGHVLFSKLDIIGAERTIVATALAPVAVLPEQQGRGIGSRLVRRGLDDCRAAGVDLVFVLGEPAYYRRFGFSAHLAAQFDSPYAGDAFMALKLNPELPQGLTGRSQYAPPFQDLGAT